METSNQFISRNFKRYKSNKKDEFFLKNGRRADTLLLGRNYVKKINNEIEEVQISNEKIPIAVTIVQDDLIEKLSPNNIDSSYFWKKATEVFPLASVSFSAESKNKSELNENSLNGNHEQAGATNELDKVFKSNPSAKMLEIGPGHGCITNYVALNHNIKNYYAIDVNPLFKFKRLYKTDGKTIPEQIPNDLDVVYSVNVFQHLSPEQRMSYYEQIKERLVPGGKFIFSMFVVTPKMENIIMKFPDGKFGKLFGMKDKNGNYYTSFFGQFTRCNTLDELEEIFLGLNMKLEIFHSVYNSFYMCATKM